MSKVRTKKSQAFKSRALKLADEIGVREAAKQMQCCPTSIHAWRRKNKMVFSKKSFDTLLSEYLDAKAALRAALDGL